MEKRSYLAQHGSAMLLVAIASAALTLFPQRGGLLPFGQEVDGQIIGWIFESGRTDWKIAFWDSIRKDAAVSTYRSFANWLADFLTGVIGSTPLVSPERSYRPKPPHFFRPIDPIALARAQGIEC
jgi:hypothetical protein